MQVKIISEIYFLVVKTSVAPIRTYRRSNGIRNANFVDILAKNVTKSKIKPQKNDSTTFRKISGN